MLIPNYQKNHLQQFLLIISIVHFRTRGFADCEIFKYHIIFNKKKFRPIIFQRSRCIVGYYM